MPIDVGWYEVDGPIDPTSPSRPNIRQSGVHSAVARALASWLGDELICARIDLSGRPLVVGIGGSVAVGKSTVAADLVAYLATRGITTTVIATDGFLFPNSVLAARGAIDRKGEPDTYDEDALAAVLGAIRDGAASVEIPTYSHRSFDVVAGVPVMVGGIVLVEGVNALQPRLAARQDLSVYLDAPDDVVKRWFVDRFLRHVDDAETDPQSFYRRFLVLNPDGRADMAVSVWEMINLPNLVRFVAPTRANADLVVTFDATHSVQRVTRTAAG